MIEKIKSLPLGFFIPVVIVVLVFIVGFVFVLKQFGVMGTTQITYDRPTPSGIIHANATSFLNTDPVTLTATYVHGALDAQIDNVRYYLLNPILAEGNNWSNPDWCSAGSPCAQSTQGGYITYDLGQSSNPADSYAITWDKNTHSSGSTPYSRALKPSNIPPGTYKIGLRVEDVNGNVKGDASFITVNIGDGTIPRGKIQASSLSVPNTGSVVFSATDVKGGEDVPIDNVRYYLLNPKLGTYNDWKNPDWCSTGSPCTQATKTGLITYDISQSSNPADNFAVTWDKNTHASGSTPYSRALIPGNIPPGTYKVALRVEDVNGRVNGDASSLTLTITKGDVPCSVTCDNNADGVVTVSDTEFISKNCWASKPTSTNWENCKNADLNLDNYIGMPDILQFSKCCPISTPTPTPTPTPNCSTTTYCQGRDLWGEQWDMLLGACMPYTVQVNAPQCISSPAPTPSPATSCIFGCDLNGDGKIDNTDVTSKISPCWGVASSGSRWPECRAYDFNNDNMISMTDVLSFSKCCLSSPSPQAMANPAFTASTQSPTVMQALVSAVANFFRNIF